MKVAVTTAVRGLRRRRLFVTGTVEQLKNRWRRQGVDIVNRVEEADLVVVPDGTPLPAHSSRYVSYSEFVARLDRPQIEEKKQKEAKEKASRPEADDEFQDILDFVHRELGRLPPTHRSPRPDLSTFLNPQLPTLIDTVLRRPFHYQTYETKSRVLSELSDRLWETVRYYGSLRSSLAAVLPVPALATAVDPEAPCAPVGDDMREAWRHFRDYWSPEKQQEVEGLTGDASTVDWLLSIETDLHRMLAGTLCAKLRLAEQHTTWLENTRGHFERYLSQGCSPHSCDRTMCVFQVGRCREKPLLWVMEELTVALCGGPANLLEKFAKMVKGLYKKWFGSLPASLSGQVTCDKVRTMSQKLLEELRSALGTPSQELILWSELPELLDVSAVDWDALFSRDQPGQRDEAVQRLKSVTTGQAYLSRLRDLVLAWQAL